MIIYLQGSLFFRTFALPSTNEGKPLEPRTDKVRCRKSMATYSKDMMIKTNRKVRVTFAGWDGKSYNGEGRNLTVYKHPFIAGDFVRGYFKGDRCYHKVTDDKHPVSGERMVEFFTYFSKD